LNALDERCGLFSPTTSVRGQAVGIPLKFIPRPYFCFGLSQAGRHSEGGLTPVKFGEFGKNFIEIGKRPKVQESMLRLAMRFSQTEFRIVRREK
jgi:hypothetical protein